MICEGELDALSIAMAGYPAALSVPNGARAKACPYIADVEQMIDAAPVVVVAVDADDPGRALETELIRVIGPEACRRARWPEGCNDANDVLMQHGLGVLRACLDAAEDVPVAGVVSPDDVESEYEDLYRHGIGRGLMTGWESIDQYYTVVPGYITLISGAPNSGKTEWLDHLMINMANNYEWKFAVFSPESLPHAEHLSRWAEKYQELPFFAGASARMTWDQAVFAKRWAQQHVRFIDPDPPTLDNILSLAKGQLRRFGINALVIDPWNEVDEGEAISLRDDKYLSRALRTLRRFAEQHIVHIFVVIHPHALQMDRETRQYPPVDIYDLSGGAMWANKAGAILSLWRDNVDPVADVKLYVKKVKTRRIGRRGRINLGYDRTSGRYTDAGNHGEAG